MGAKSYFGEKRVVWGEKIHGPKRRWSLSVVRRKKAGRVRVQKAAGLLGGNAEGRALVAPQLRRKAACWGEKQKAWGLRCANAGGRGVALGVTFLPQDTTFSPPEITFLRKKSLHRQNTARLQKIGYVLHKGPLSHQNIVGLPPPNAVFLLRKRYIFWRKVV